MGVCLLPIFFQFQKEHPRQPYKNVCQRNEDERKIGNNDFTICDQLHKDNDILSVHLHNRGSCIRVRSRFNLKCNFVHCSKMDPNLLLISCQNCAISNMIFFVKNQMSLSKNCLIYFFCLFYGKFEF